MECFRLLESLDVLGYAGICIGAENSQMLQNSLIILQQENHFQKCYYWGKIFGVQSDYHITYGYKKDCMGEQVYYYSIDSINWLLLPKANKCARFLTPLAINKFEGDPSIVTNVYNVNPPFPPNEDPKKYYDGPIPRELKEEDRLAATIELIKDDAMIIPRGGWFKCPNGDVIENYNFEGFSATDASYLKSYLHARPPKQKWNTNLLTRPDYNYAFDFLDTIDLDVPPENVPSGLEKLVKNLQTSCYDPLLVLALRTTGITYKDFIFMASCMRIGCWDLQLLLGKRLAILHNLYWPGMTFYYKINSPHYGFLYVGHGKKNMDVPFMV